MLKLPASLVVLALLTIFLALPAGADDGWMADSLWDDGLAEYAAYEVTWPRYGTVYEGRALLILVKEPWAPDLEVKADRPRPNGFEVLKLNHVRDVATGIYTYHQMSSLFWRRDDGALRKAVATSSEACGISTAQVLDGTLETRSYFDGQGERRQPVPAEAWLHDGLPARLRGLVTGPLPESLAVVPSLMQGRFPPLEPRPRPLRRRTVERVEVPAGTFRGVELTLEGGRHTESYTFDVEAPHVLLRYRSGDGTEYRLAKVERLAYWGLSRPGDEGWLPKEVRH